MRSSLAVFTSLAIVTAACGGDDSGLTDATPIDGVVEYDAPIDGPPAFVPPTMLSQTGLYSDIATKVLAADVIEFEPRWELWSDDAAKTRWVWFPPGSQIDTANMNYWQFPVGTKLWKEFARGGDRIETRLMQKIGPGVTWADWFFVSFQWDAGETDGTAVPDGVIDEVGSNDIPARADCRKCHTDTRVESVVIGLSALQLDVAAPTLDLAQLVADGRLTAPPTAPATPGDPYFPLPAGDVTRAAFGYLHSNCGNCHNADSDVHDVVGLELRLDVADLASWETTATYERTVGIDMETGTSGATRIVEPGVPATSALFIRLTTIGPQRMPPVGRELADPTGTETVRAWILSLPVAAD